MKARWILLVALAGPAWGAPTLSPSEELTLDAPWIDPVALSLPEPGAYRVEATGLAGDPVEFVLEQQTSGAWKAVQTNRSRRGGLDASIDWVAAGESWRVRPALAVRQTVVLRLRPSLFAALRDTIKQDLTLTPAVTLPLTWRATLPLGTGSPVIAATPQAGSLWVAWASHGQAEVWNAAGQRIGAPLALGAPWKALRWEAGHLVGWTGTEGQAWTWNGIWTAEAAGPPVWETPWGRVRVEGTPPRVWRATSLGWEDLHLPQERGLDLAQVGTTDDGLYVFLASSQTAARALYRWTVQGWQALAVPPVDGAPSPGLWVVSQGPGTLTWVEARGTSVWLRQFDGAQWRAPLDLSSLAPGGVRGLALAPPPWSRSGSLVVVTDRVSVYDLP